MNGYQLKRLVGLAGLVVLVLALVAGCANNSAESTPTPRAISSSNNDPEPTPTALVENDVEATDSAESTPTTTPTPHPDATATETPDPNVTPTKTPIPTATPTVVPQERHRLPTYEETEGKATPVPRIPVPPDTTNILLLGQDSADHGEGGLNTDAIIIVSINSDRKTATMMSLPRDLYVQIPGGNTQRINTAIYGGIDRLKNTILYNLGIEIHYYARVDFEGFQDIVDTIGGVTVINSCPMTDWRLISPELDIEDEDNWERFTLDAGVQVMDGDTALWYARSRKATNDFDRGRRQQQILRAILDQGVDANLIREVPTIWGIYRDRVETDMDIGRILQLATIAPSVRENGIQSIYLAGENVTAALTEEGYQVQLLNPEVAAETLKHFYLPPALNRATRAPITVEILNASGDPLLPILTMENLRWHGFVPTISPVTPSRVDKTTVTYYSDNNKGSFDWLMAWIMDSDTSRIILDGDTTSDYDYRIVLGSDYDPCRPELFAPKAFLTAQQNDG